VKGAHICQISSYDQAPADRTIIPNTQCFLQSRENGRINPFAKGNQEILILALVGLENSVETVKGYHLHLLDRRSTVALLSWQLYHMIPYSLVVRAIMIFRSHNLEKKSFSLMRYPISSPGSTHKQAASSSPLAPSQCARH